MFSLFTDYIKWHYMYAVVNILRLAKEFTSFFLNLFSVPLFLRTLFSPIFSIPVYEEHSADVIDMVAVFLAGIIIRLLGAVFRLVLIAIGLFFSIINLVFFALVFVIWLIMPIVFVAMVYYLIALSLKIL